MLTSNQVKAPVKAVLKVSMVVAGEYHERGETVELSARDFNYLKNFDRVAEATKDNVAEVKAAIKADDDAAVKAAK
jgi:hypothetical protein